MAVLALQIWSAVHSDSAPVLTLREARSLGPAQLSVRLMGEGSRPFPEAWAYQVAIHGPGLAGVELAVATFQRGGDAHRLLDVRIETDASEPSGPPCEFTLTRISIAGRSFVN